MIDIHELADEIVTALLTMYDGETGDRLAIMKDAETGNELELGGNVKRSAVNVVVACLRKA